MFPGSSHVRAQENSGESGSDIIRKLREKFEKSKREVEEGEKKLKEKEQQRKKVMKELDNTEKGIERLQGTIRKISNEEKHLNREIQASRKRLEETSQDMKTHSGEYARQLRAMYRRQNVSALEMFFTSGSVSSMLRGFKMFATVAKNDVELLQNLREKIQITEKDMKVITRARDAQQVLGKKRKREQLSLAKTNKSRKNLIEEIKKDEELWKERIEKYEREMKLTRVEMDKRIKQLDKEVKEIKISDTLKNYNFAVRKGKLPWPVKGKIVGRFGIITDPKTKTKTTNRGVEIETKHGEVVSAIGSGIVVMTQYYRGYGNFVMIYHPHEPNKFYTIYAHLSDILVNNGIEVGEGEIIGLAGSTGLISDDKAQLLLEVLNGKNPENPLSWLRKN
ncbi:MAG: peptidoglycan DD-metalloendopeptidase family protein [Candidatus Latescibacteria bacterium]|nr:peptidoglycan DD-metalloendopeptidase family protein [Candidatus Latescibacterota bacterium]